MKLVVGLGNPGKQHNNTWHNIGFMTIDVLADILNAPKAKKSTKLKAEVMEIAGDEKIILAKPLTFMNLSGVSVAALAKFYKIKTKDTIIIQDDLDLPLGKIRLAYNSSAGGHNGIKSIIEHLKTQEFCRVKIGIGTEKLKLMDPADYVLGTIAGDQEKIIKTQVEKSAEAVLEAIKTSPTRAMNQYN
jgi:peptidyl-tRNA hydrolase, PTH1 family